MTERLLCIALTAGVFASCIPLPGGRSVGQQEITGKTGDDTLVARSGDTCRVAADVFERLRIGDTHVCAWQSARATGEAVAGDPKRGVLPGAVARPKLPPPQH